jgi:quinol monooxygenase YgiN
MATFNVDERIALQAEERMRRKRRISFGVVARIRCLPENARELRGRLIELMKLTENEKGCISCEVIENDYDSTEFTLIEEWSNEQAHRAHFGSSLIRKALAFLPKLLSRDLDLRTYVMRFNSIKYGTNSYSLAMG